MDRRVVITGIGAVTPLAAGAEESWNKLIEGKSGITKISRFDVSSLKCRVAGEARSFVPENFMPSKEIGRTDRIVHFIVAAADMAMKDAEFEVASDEEYRTGVVIASATGSCKTFEMGHELVVKGQLRRVSPGLIINHSANTAAGTVAVMHRAKGPHHFLQEAHMQ